LGELLEKRPAIYLFYNKVSKKIYIGQTKNLHGRIKEYGNSRHLYYHRSSTIARMIRNFGWNNFSFTILEHCDINKLREREQFYINLYKPQYNIRTLTHKSDSRDSSSNRRKDPSTKKSNKVTSKEGKKGK